MTSGPNGMSFWLFANKLVNVLYHKDSSTTVVYCGKSSFLDRVAGKSCSYSSNHYTTLMRGMRLLKDNLFIYLLNFIQRLLPSSIVTESLKLKIIKEVDTARNMFVPIIVTYTLSVNIWL